MQLMDQQQIAHFTWFLQQKLIAQGNNEWTYTIKKTQLSNYKYQHKFESGRPKIELLNGETVSVNGFQKGVQLKNNIRTSQQQQHEATLSDLEIC
ncbi:hypothetical protein TTHERM_000475299 (macronuclear) [Tetrahymena thermophila SB210]|uniref:Uncharacterized protein n=1 Tax=Tetrahymena thermophila (strain SB210) TaxID=312017 RepID=W7X6P8_TETTS|nr:hypothetical protein TTHERM_000475299 [Tetrahymena thermophila SB210]EWS72053.1 hypothetical protein TTHERM_000475299 [Tetrahymena thermophila SB210]|eukprot:XP_012655428.1 hypothetical protein TTHERM_000475299 [Tetrahymena thermophila SB210]